MFIGREKELSDLNELYEKDGFQMPIIYGRRRIGKSTLIKKFVEGKKTCFFTAIESSMERNLELFSRSIYKTLMPNVKNLPPFQSFESAFEFLTQHIMTERLILVIDEYPYLANADGGISSLIQSYIDTQWNDSKLYLILCGSSMSFMEKQVLGYQSPLYGRRTAQIKLLPFDYLTSARFVPNYTDEEKALVYGVTGGVPKYLELFNPNISVYDNIIKLFFDSTGYLYEEPGNLLKQELRDVSTYNAIVEALASGASKMNEIVTKTHSDTASVSYCLKSLMSIGIVDKHMAITEEDNKKKTSYTICDNMFRFWYRFVPDGIDLIQLQQGRLYFDETVKNQISDYMGKIFEDMCRYFLMKKSSEGKMDFTIMKIGSWWGTNPITKKEEEIDIVGINQVTKQALIGECKYQNQQIKEEVVSKLIERGTLIKAYPNKQFVLCSKMEFSENIKEIANKNNMLLVTLEDLYRINSYPTY